MPHPRGRILAIFVAFALMLAGCSSTDRPDAERWRLDWQMMVSLIPDQFELGDPPNQELCQETLAGIRAQSEDLLPSPASSIDELANQWISIAEEAFFDCPPEGQEIASFDDVYIEMQRVQDSVDTALADSE
jgi:hypothetical protein